MITLMEQRIGQVLMSMPKMPTTPDEKAFTFLRRYGSKPQEIKLALTSSKWPPVPTQTERIVNFLRTNPGSTMLLIRGATKIHPHTLSPLLAKLAKNGVVKRVKARRSWMHRAGEKPDNAMVWRYSLPPKKIDDYCGSWGEPYQHPTRIGYLSIPVLEFLWAKRLSEVTMGYVHALRPSSIRITPGCCTADSRKWRVTIIVLNDIIQSITQEVEVMLPEGVVHGAALNAARWHGIDSEQVRWHAIEGDEVYDSVSKPGKHFKLVSKGKKVVRIPYPEPTYGSS